MIGEGTQVGPYLIDRRLGKGATGTVYHAWNTHGKMPVAIKVLAPELAAMPAMVTMFEEEAKAGLQLRHPNVVETLFLGRFHEQPFIVFEFVHGQSLQEVLQKGPLTEGQCIWVMRPMAQALRVLRQKGIVHQDIKPDNILIEASGNCKLVDLGYARVAHGGGFDWSGLAAGTALYMSPEQCHVGPSVVVDVRSDLYALGCTIYHAATGTPPFVAEYEGDVMRKQIAEKPVAPNVRVKTLSPDLTLILLKLLQKDPAQRYQTPEELLLDMRTLKVTPQVPTVIVSRGNR